MYTVTVSVDDFLAVSNVIPALLYYIVHVVTN